MFVLRRLMTSQTACSTTVSYKMCCILKHNLIILRSLFASQSCLLSGIYCCLQLFTVIYYTLYLLIVVSRMPMRPCLHYMKKIVSLRSIKKYLKSLYRYVNILNKDLFSVLIIYILNRSSGIVSVWHIDSWSGVSSCRFKSTSNSSYCSPLLVIFFSFYSCYVLLVE